MPDSGSGSGQRVVLHVGLPKTGTTFLQGLLGANREQLRAGGVLYPELRPGAMFHGAVEIRGSAAKFGLRADLVAGTWSALCEQARAHDGTTILGHEVLAGATRDQVRAALEPLAGLDVHVVVTARDLGRQAVAHWQEEVKLGATWSFAELEATELRADPGPDLERGLGPDDGGDRPRFWHAQDFADCLRRWTSDLPVGRAHLVVLPPPGTASTELWARFAEAAGVDPALAQVPPEAANPSLGVAEIALLREVNARLEGRLDRPAYLRTVKREYAEAVLARRSGPRPRTPYDLGEVLGTATTAWVRQAQEAAVVVHGSLDDLAPVLAGPDEPRPDDTVVAEDPQEVADRLVGLPEPRSRRWFGRFRK